MKCLTKSLIIVLVVALTMTLAGAVLLGITFTGSFDALPLAATLNELGLLGVLLSGIALIVVVTVNALRDEKK